MKTPANCNGQSATHNAVAQAQRDSQAELAEILKQSLFLAREARNQDGTFIDQADAFRRIRMIHILSIAALHFAERCLEWRKETI